MIYFDNGIRGVGQSVCGDPLEGEIAARCRTLGVWVGGMAVDVEDIYLALTEMESLREARAEAGYLAPGLDVVDIDVADEELRDGRGNDSTIASMGRCLPSPR